MDYNMECARKFHNLPEIAKLIFIIYFFIFVRFLFPRQSLIEVSPINVLQTQSRS